MSAQKITSLQKVTKKYFLDDVEVDAVKNVSLDINKGDFVAIIGPSGSGKSTLMHLIGCLDKPTSGEVFIEDKKISGLNENQLSEIRNKKIGFIFQSYNLLQKTSALENVQMPLLYQGVGKKERDRRSKELLIKLGLENRLGHFPSQLSGGQQQRVAIARALVTNPALILADEPTGNLDSKTGKEILELMKSLNKEGITIVIVTHDTEVAKSTNKIITIKDGEVVK